MPDEGTHQMYLSFHLARYAFARAFVQNKTVLDVACGCGYGSSYLARADARVIGGDNSRAAIDAADHHYKKDGNPEFVLLDAGQFPFRDEAFDTVVSFETLEHISQYEEFLSECKRVLKARGVFICSTPNKGAAPSGREQSLNVYHLKEFYPEEFEELLKKNFNCVELYAQSLTGVEDAGGRGSVISRLRNFNLFLMHTIPGLQAIEVLVARNLIPRYRMLKLKDLNDDDFDRLVDEKHFPFPLRKDFLGSVPLLVAICHKGG